MNSWIVELINREGRVVIAVGSGMPDQSAHTALVYAAKHDPRFIPFIGTKLDLDLLTPLCSFLTPIYSYHAYRNGWHIHIYR